MGMAILQILLLLIGFVLLVKGADLFVDGASGIAQKLKVSTFVIGLTVVALGTSAPEAAVSIVGAVTGTGDVIIGNVIGSNIMNILLILGIASLITTVPIEKSSKNIEIPFLIVISGTFCAFAFMGNNFVWWEGLILLVLYAAFMVYTMFMAKRTSAVLLDESGVSAVAEEEAQGTGLVAKLSEKYEELKDKVWFLIVITLIGLAMVVGGAELVVNSAKFIAKDLLGIPEMVVGLTVVAFGTSLPELVTSISAAKKGDMGIATGNIIGSNIANLLFVGGLGFVCSGANPINVINPVTFYIDVAVSVIATLILWAFAFGKKRQLNKVSGVIMLAVLVAYYTYLFLNAFGIIIL